MMLSPFVLPPRPEAQEAARKVIEKVHAYMRVHPESELTKGCMTAPNHDP